MKASIVCGAYLRNMDMMHMKQKKQQEL